MQHNITCRKKDGGWQYIVSYKQDGNWKQTAKQGFPGKKEAKSAADDRVIELRDEVQIDPALVGMTFKEFTEVFNQHEKVHNRKGTRNVSKTALRRFSELNDKLLVDIKPIHIQVIVDDMYDKEGLKTITIRNYVNRLSKLFRLAERQFELVGGNPTDRIIYKNSKTKDFEREPLTDKEVKDLVEKLEKQENKKVYIGALFVLNTGVRISELCGITWTDIDLKERTVTIDKQLDSTSTADNIKLVPPKSKNGYREIPIPNDFMRLLMRYKKENHTDIINRVFPFTSMRVAHDRFRTVFDEIGYPDLTVHTLRHTYGTNLSRRINHNKTAAYFMGHTEKEFSKTYDHVTDDTINEAVKQIRNM